VLPPTINVEDEMDTHDSAHTEPKRLSLIWGARNIANEVGISQRQAFYLLEGGQIPAKKIGGRWVVDRDVLREFFRNTVGN
jgi:hypothetical protein